MKTPVLVALIVILAATAFAAQPPAPAISQVMAFWCNNDYTSCPLGFDPALSPIQTSDGLLYVPTFWGGQGNSNFGGTILRSSTTGQSLVIHTFASVAGRFLGGENPVLSFSLGTDGNFYGVTENGGTQNSGVFYKLARTGQFQILHNFCSQSGCPDGPAQLVQANDGNFYGASGTTFFRLTPQGVWSQIGTLDLAPNSLINVIQATDGNFYGVAQNFIFRMTPAGQFTLLHQFSYPLFPSSPLIQASDGNLYGATNGSGDGTGIFRLTLDGTFTFIHTMTENEGFAPNQLLQASDGNLWGLSQYRDGSYFTITLGGQSIQSAAFSCANGCSPTGMVEGRDGNFYGSAINGGHINGEHPLGTIFKIAAGLPH